MGDFKEQRICYKFCFNLKKIVSETYRTLIKAFSDDTMNWVQTLNGIHVSCHQTSAGSFECSGHPPSSQTGENVENMCRISYEECVYVYMMMFQIF